MGEVWLADDVVLGRQVAIKWLRADPSAGIDSSAIDRMVREARVAARLHHPHAVAVFDLVAEDGQPFVVMEFVDGESLAERIRRQGRLVPAQAAQIIGAVAGALDAAHRVGVVHRDVKPANIMVDHCGDAKLADFGIARGLGDAALTDTGQMIGTLAYMAPELARTGEASAASDVWSLGATLYAAVEGRAPYDDGSKPNTTAMLIRLVTEPVPEPTHAGVLLDVLLQMLDPNPSLRPTAGETQRRLAVLGSPAAPSADHGSENNQSEVTRAARTVLSGTAVAPLDSRALGADTRVAHTVRRTRVPQRHGSHRWVLLGTAFALVIAAATGAVAFAGRTHPSAAGTVTSQPPHPTLATRPPAPRPSASTPRNGSVTVARTTSKTPTHASTPPIPIDPTPDQRPPGGWIVIFASIDEVQSNARAKAESIREMLIARGLYVRVTSTDSDPALRSGYWIVYLSEPSQSAAEQDLPFLRQRSGIGDAYRKCASPTGC